MVLVVGLAVGGVVAWIHIAMARHHGSGLTLQKKGGEGVKGN